MGRFRYTAETVISLCTVAHKVASKCRTVGQREITQEMGSGRPVSCLDSAEV